MSKYTRPGLRARIVARVTASGKGGKPGQWSARKAQIVAREYEAAGGGYTGRRGAAQKSLRQWTKEDWTTSDDKPAIREGGTSRYLPRAAWKKLSPAQRKATNAKKRAASREGRQFVANTKAARTARKRAIARARKARR